MVPAKNEERSMRPILRELHRYSDDITVIDGHSIDQTELVARSFGVNVIKDNRKGKGDAVRLGLSVARHPITVFIDADGSHDPADIPKLVEPIAAGRADLVIGSRMRGGSDELFGTLPEAIRLAGQVVIALTINYRFGVRLTDYQNGFRAIRTEVGNALGLQSNLPTIEQEMAMKCLQYGYRVFEEPTHEYARTGGVSKINPLEMSPQYVWSLISGVCVRRKPTPTAIVCEPIVTDLKTVAVAG